MTKIAIIITGELRIKHNAHLDRLKNFFKGYDIFISTYKKYSIIAKSLTDENRICYLDPDNFSHPPEEGHIFQFYHLEKIANNFEEMLYDYDVILKSRTDLIPKNGLNLGKILQKKAFYPKPEDVEKSTMYLLGADMLFICKPYHFLHLFKNVSCEIENFIHKNNEYIPINYKNLFHSLVFLKKPWDTRHFCFPDLILNNNNLLDQAKLKYYIEKEQLHLLDPNVNNNLKLIQARIYERTYFQPHRFIFLHCLKFGLVKLAEIPVPWDIQMFKCRHFYNYKRIDD